MAYLDFEKPLVELERRIADLKAASDGLDGLDTQIAELEARAQTVQRNICDQLSIWQKVQLSRHPDRPYFLDYVEHCFTDFTELHGDRLYSDDSAIIAGFARFNGRPVAIIGHQKGRSTKEKVHRNFGMAHPEGYRKACRIMELASRFGRPVLTFIDTPGAYPGLGAEERGQSEAIGHALYVMSQLKVPVIATVIGEGGSGGALALGVANRVLMLQYSTYSVITPEGCASILWRDGAHAPDAAEQLKLLAPNASKLGIVEEIVEEPVGGAHRDVPNMAQRLTVALEAQLKDLDGLSAEELIEDRYAKFRKIGAYNG